MTQFAADDFAYIAAKQREIAEKDAAARTTMTARTIGSALLLSDDGTLSVVAAPSLDMDAANEPVTTADNTLAMREWLVCVMCNHKWHGIESTDNCPACHVKNPTIPF